MRRGGSKPLSLTGGCPEPLHHMSVRCPGSCGRPGLASLSSTTTSKHIQTAFLLQVEASLGRCEKPSAVYREVRGCVTSLTAATFESRVAGSDACALEGNSTGGVARAVPSALALCFSKVRASWACSALFQ